MNNLVEINNTQLEVKEYEGKRVVTFKEIDAVHERVDGTAGRNFRDNKKHFIESVDYFMVKPADIQNNEIRLSEINNRGTILITESGYLMLVKSFTDDLAWAVQRDLVNKYFKVKNEVPQVPQTYIEALEQNIHTLQKLVTSEKEKEELKIVNEVQEQQIKELEPKAEYTDKVLNNKDLLTVTVIAKDFGMTAQELNQTLNDLKIQYKRGQQWFLYKKFQGRGYTQSVTTLINFGGKICLNTKWTQRGRVFIHYALKQIGILPLAERDDLEEII